MFLLYKDVVLFAITSEDTQKHMHVIKNLCMHTPSYDLILSSLPLIPWPWKGLLSTCSRFKTKNSHKLSKITWEASTKIQKTQKQIGFEFKMDARYEEMVWKWDASCLLHEASLYSSMVEAILKHKYITTWERCGGSCFTHYITHVPSN